MDNKKYLLKKAYNFYIDNYHNSGYHPHPSNLLAILLIANKEQYNLLYTDELDFYLKHKFTIDKLIYQIIQDFNIDNNELISYFLLPENTLKNPKLWNIFIPDISLLQTLNNEELTEYQIYDLIPNQNIFYKMTDIGLVTYQKYSPTRKLDTFNNIY